jgi:hypothetical protein
MTHLSSAGDFTKFLSIAINDSPGLPEQGIGETITMRRLRMSSMKMRATPGVFAPFLERGRSGSRLAFWVVESKRLGGSSCFLR